MTDNTRLNPGSSGDLISTDDLGGSPAVKVQRVKVQYGADGSATDVSAAAPLPVQEASPGFTAFVGTALNNTNAVHDVNAALSANATHLRFYITALAASSSVTMEILQADGGSYSTAFSVLAFEDPEVFTLDGVSIDSVRITNGSAVDLDYVLLAW